MKGKNESKIGIFPSAVPVSAARSGCGIFALFFVISPAIFIESSFDNESYFNNKKYVPSYLLKPSVITADNIGTLIDTGAYKWDSDHKYLISAD